jgi:hypothetical protein
MAGATGGLWIAVDKGSSAHAPLVLYAALDSYIRGNLPGVVIALLLAVPAIPSASGMQSFGFLCFFAS